MNFYYESPRYETEMCWSNSTTTIQQINKGIDPMLLTSNPCSNMASTDIGLCAGCYETLTGRAARKAAPLVHCSYEPFVGVYSPPL